MCFADRSIANGASGEARGDTPPEDSGGVSPRRQPQWVRSCCALGSDSWRCSLSSGIPVIRRCLGQELIRLDFLTGHDDTSIRSVMIGLMPRRLHPKA